MFMFKFVGFDRFNRQQAVWTGVEKFIFVLFLLHLET